MKKSFSYGAPIENSTETTAQKQGNAILTFQTQRGAIDANTVPQWQVFRATGSRGYSRFMNANGKRLHAGWYYRDGEDNWHGPHETMRGALTARFNQQVEALHKLKLRNLMAGDTV